MKWYEATVKGGTFEAMNLDALSEKIINYYCEDWHDDRNASAPDVEYIILFEHDEEYAVHAEGLAAFQHTLNLNFKIRLEEMSAEADMERHLRSPERTGRI